MGIEAIAKNHFQPPKTIILPKKKLENYDLKVPNLLYDLTFIMSFVCHLHIICMRSYFTYMHSYVIRMSVLCTRMSSICHLYVPVCHRYVTRMYSYVIRMSLPCGFTMNLGFYLIFAL